MIQICGSLVIMISIMLNNNMNLIVVRPYIPYPREKAPMGDAPYIGLKLGGGRTFA